MIALTVESPDQPQVRALLAASDSLMASLYPPSSNHLLDIDALERPEVTFIVAREAGNAVGCAALVGSDEWAELKRMFVSPAARGRGIGRLLLQRIERIAVESGFGLLRLETGVRQSEALALYRSAGFVEIPPFGTYGPDPLSLFMQKRVGPRSK